MGQSTAEAVREIEQARERLGMNLQELTERLPPPIVWSKRVIGAGVGGGLTASAFWMVVRRIRRKHRSPDTPPPRMIVQLVPDRWAEAIDVRQWKGPLIGLMGIWFLLRLAELRGLKQVARARWVP